MVLSRQSGLFRDQVTEPFMRFSGCWLRLRAPSASSLHNRAKYTAKKKSSDSLSLIRPDVDDMSKFPEDEERVPRGCSKQGARCR